MIYLPDNPQKYYMISIATKMTLTIKYFAHLTIGVKFNVFFMRNNIFYKTFLNLSHFTSQIQNFFNFSDSFCSNHTFENANMFHFLSPMWS